MELIINCDDQQEVDQVEEALAGGGSLFLRRGSGPELIADSYQITALGNPVTQEEG